MTLWIVTLSGLGMALILVILVAALAISQKRAAQDAREWGRQVLRAQDSERRRIARELHDGVASELTRTWSTARHLGLDTEITSQLERLTAEVRAVSHGLYPPSLDASSLFQMLGDLVEENPVDGGTVVTRSGAETRQLDEAERLAFYRVAQEAIYNARRHGNAAQVILTLRDDNYAVQLVIEDDGDGIPEATLNSSTFGIRSMRERMEMIGGTLTIESAPGEGTRVTARLPLR